MTSCNDYDYELPRELIAQHPLQARADARLLVVRRATADWKHAHIRDLPSFLSPGDALVLNNTRVIPARLVGHRTLTGGRWTGLFVAASEQGAWQILSRTRGKIQAGETVTLRSREPGDPLTLEMMAPMGGGLWIARPHSEEPYLELLDRFGQVPLPPYIRDGEMAARDLTDYQTVFAEQPGAIAAPTAGLHFTEELLAQLSAGGIDPSYITLHVGIGTFRPLAAEQVEDHAMHAEWASIDRPTAERLAARRAAGGRIVAVGTTVVRTLETAARGGSLQEWSGDTDLYICPPYEFQGVDAMLTNFHLPKTTLLVLVRTFGGDKLMRAAYSAAIEEGYRFYSYGDAMLIL